MKTFIQSCMILLALTILTGIAYPLLVTGVSISLFKDKAQGQLVSIDGKVLASNIIAQKITSPKYFWPRPSGADYNASSSSGTNLGPTSSELKKQYEARLKVLKEIHPDQGEPPQDLLFASGSGLDPEISPAAAAYQLNRVAKARNLTHEQVIKLKTLVDDYTEGPTLGFIGESRVNVMRLNLALDRIN
ncbi:MAG: potassium-transporting ATPase subunit KdpC [Pseudobdellovibrionaceae bacterium]